MATDIRYRPMQPEDVPSAARIVAADPVVGPRYGTSLTGLASAWRQVVGSEATRAIVVERTSDAGTEIIGAGMSAFVSDSFMREVKTPPFFWAGPELTQRILSGVSPLLSDRQVRRANSSSGLNLIVWEGVTEAKSMANPEAHLCMLSGFVERHRGYFLKELLGHGTSVVGLEATFRMGNLFLSTTNGSYIDYLEDSPENLLMMPHYIGINRELALSRVGTWVGQVFDYRPPQFALRPSEQRLLLCALHGGTDAELALELEISLSTVKKRWLGIYERIAARDASVVPLQDEKYQAERGKGKKARLLAYLADHMEELRPAANRPSSSRVDGSTPILMSQD